MGTLVETPDRTDVKISGLQASTHTDGKGGGLGTFLTNLLPAVNAELGKYDDASRDRLIALGRNDQLNGVMNEVSLLDRKNYQTGRDYQTVVNGQIVLTQKFQAEVNAAEAENFDPDALLQKGRTFADDSVTNIFNSNLPDEIKRGLYEEQLKTNSTYMTMVEKRIKRIAEDTAATTRVNSLAILASDLSESEFGVEELQVNLSAHVNKAIQAQLLADPEKSLETIYDEVGADLKSVMSYKLSSLKANGTEEDFQRVQYLSDASEVLSDLGFFGIAQEIQQKANEYSASIQTDVIARVKYDVQSVFNSWETEPETLTKEGVTALVTQVMGNEAIPKAERLNISSDILERYAGKVAKIMNAEVVPNVRDYDLSGWKALGKSEDSYATEVVQSYLKEYSAHPATAGILALRFFSEAAEYSPAGMRESSKVIFGVLLGHARMSDEQVAADQYSKIRAEQFEVTKMLYNKFRAENVTKAHDVLSGIPDEYKDAFSSAFENNRNLEDVRMDFKNPASVQQQYAALEHTLGDLTSIAKGLALGNEVWMGGSGGTLTKNMSDGAEGAYVSAFMEAVRGSLSTISGKKRVSNASTLISVFKDNGGLRRSPRGYSDVIMNLAVARQVEGFKLTGTHVPLGADYVTEAMDRERERYAKKYGTSASNVHVMSDATGQNMRYEIYESQGILGKSPAKLKATEYTPMANIKYGAELLYKEDSKQRESSTGQSTRMSSTQLGKAMLVDHHSRQQSTVNVNAHYAAGMGGNLELGTDWVNHMAIMEGTVKRRTQTKDRNSGRISHVYGMGMTEKTLNDMGMLNEAKAVSATGDMQKIVDFQGRFMQKYYKNMPPELAAIGIPAPSGTPYPAKWRSSLMLAYDVKWHAGTTGRTGKRGQIKGLSDAMNATSYAKGRAILQKLSTYNRENLGSKRNRFMENALADHFRARGVR